MAWETLRSGAIMSQILPGHWCDLPLTACTPPGQLGLLRKLGLLCSLTLISRVSTSLLLHSPCTLLRPAPFSSFDPTPKQTTLAAWTHTQQHTHYLLGRPPKQRVWEWAIIALCTSMYPFFRLVDCRASCVFIRIEWMVVSWSRNVYVMTNFMSFLHIVVTHRVK